MINFKSQKDRWNQILRERKYRPSFFGLSSHFDWKMVLIFVVLSLIINIGFGFYMRSKINEISEKDYSGDVIIKTVRDSDIENYQEILEKIKN